MKCLHRLCVRLLLMQKRAMKKQQKNILMNFVRELKNNRPSGQIELTR